MKRQLHSLMKNGTRSRCARAYFCLIFALCALFAAKAQEPGASPETLKFVVVLSRHGVRSPTGSADQLNQYASQAWPKWDVPPGYLTVRGAELMSLLGRYDAAYFAGHGLLQPSSCSDGAKVDFYADADQRTIETAKALAAGMFPGCAVRDLPRQHTSAEGEPLFHPLPLFADKLDHSRAAASIAGRIGDNPAALTVVYDAQLDRMESILLGCPGAQPCPGHAAAKLLADIPAALDAGKGDHLADLKGPLNTAATLSEDFLLEYADGKPVDQVGWGRVDPATLRQLMELHTAASDLTRRTPYLATIQASNIVAHILDTLQQAATGKPVPGALGTPADKVVFLVAHDTNLANVAGMLQIHWLLDGRLDDTPPGGALVFELWQGPANGAYQVRVAYTAQTLEQMRNVVPLTLRTPPARAAVFLPGCSLAGPGYPCDWQAFSRAISALINPDFVR